MKYIFGLLCCVTFASAWFYTTCPQNCADARCMTTGCFKCKPGFCRYYSQRYRISTCVSKCPDGFGCYKDVDPTAPFCSACNIRNCKECELTYTPKRRECTKCEYRYTLTNNRCESKYRRYWWQG